VFKEAEEQLPVYQEKVDLPEYSEKDSEA